MTKSKREELIKLIVQKAGLPSDGSYVDYLTRQQLLELHSFLDVNADKLNLAIDLITNIHEICLLAVQKSSGKKIPELVNINELIKTAKEILGLEGKNITDDIDNTDSSTVNDERE